MRDTAFKLYLVFVPSWFLHSPARIPALALFRVDLLLICLIAGLILASPSPTPTGLNTRTNRIILILIAYVILVVPFVEWPGSVLNKGLPDLIKALVFYYFTASLLTSERKLSQFLTVFLICQTFRVLEPLYLHVTEGYWGSVASMANWEMLDRLSGAPSDIVNPNGLAFVILTVLPFAHYLWTTSRLGAVAYIAILPLLVWALLLTSSRSGIVGLAAIFLAIWYRSRRKVLMTAMIVGAIFFTIPNLTPDQLDRYVSIYDSNAKNAATADGRIEGWTLDFTAAMRRPLFGHGLGTSVEVNYHYAGGRAAPSHNLYTEVLEEIGFVGLGIFVCLILSILGSVRRTLRQRTASRAPSGLLVRLCLALQTFVFMNLLFSFFSYGLTSYEWYLLAGLSAVVTNLLDVQAVETAAVAPIGAAAAVPSHPVHWPLPLSGVKRVPARSLGHRASH